MTWARHLRPALAEIQPYDVAPADPSQARMHANECAQPWPPEVMDAVAEVIRNVELGRYPDTSGRRVRALLAKQHGCAPERVVLGNGSDEIISTLLTTLSGSDAHLVIPSPTFVMYAHSAAVVGMPVRQVPLREDFTLDPDAMDAALEGAALCFLARPNNPTGTLWNADTIDSRIERHPDTVFVIDEAYTAYADPHASMWKPDRPNNYVHMSTMSKVGGAALRLGYCIATPALAHELNKVRHPYNISATSLAIAELLLSRFEHVQAQMVKQGRYARDRIASLFASIPGTTVFPSAANLVLARFSPPQTAVALHRHLAAHGVLVKDVTRTLPGCLRASAGTNEELARFENALRSFRAPQLS